MVASKIMTPITPCALTVDVLERRVRVWDGGAYNLNSRGEIPTLRLGRGPADVT